MSLVVVLLCACGAEDRPRGTPIKDPDVFHSPDLDRIPISDRPPFPSPYAAPNVPRDLVGKYSTDSASTESFTLRGDGEYEDSHGTSGFWTLDGSHLRLSPSNWSGSARFRKPERVLEAGQSGVFKEGSAWYRKSGS